MKELETLLGTLLKMGWKPWGLKSYSEALVSGTVVTFYTEKGAISHTSLREIVSLESKLWQFVVENRMVKENDDVRIKNYRGDNECDTNCCYDDYEYRLIESAITPERELAKFLVDNILIDG